MTVPCLKTNRLELIPHTPQHLRALIRGPEAYATSFGRQPAEGLADFAGSTDVSPAWLAQLEAATEANPWIHGFALLHTASGIVIGLASFKGPPGASGLVEIAYGVAPAYRGKGYATEAAQALLTFAFGTSQVVVVRAHTLPTPNPSTRVLTKCGFKYLGEIVDSQDGLLWRWEKHQEPASDHPSCCSVG